MLKALSFLLVLVAAAWWFTVGPGGAVPPCTRPIAYEIGAFDQRFDVSRTDFLSALSEAEAIWERPSGRDLFVYKTEGGALPVNLVYDYRQETTEELGSIESNLKTNETSYDSLEASYKRLESEYNSLKSAYDRQVAEFQSKRRVTNAEIEALRSLEDELNGKATELNALADRLNKLAKSLNLNVSQYNAVGAARGETFEGGIYYNGPEGEGINIYEFDSRTKLVRLLAHEFGHALGLEHVSDPLAIMYKINNADFLRATPADLQALETLC